MKKSSVVIMIIGGVFLVAGLILCLYSSLLAKKTDQPLYDTTVDMNEENGTRTYDFTDQDISRLKVEMSGADLHFYASDNEKSYVELVNFSTGTFDLDVSNRMLTVSNQMGISGLSGNNGTEDGMLSDLIGNFSFKGLRYLLKYTAAKAGEGQTVNIYLAASSPMKIITVNNQKCNISVENLSLSCDYDLELDKGEISLKKMKTVSSVTLMLGIGNVSIEDSVVSTCKLDLDNGNLETNRLTVGVLIGNVTKGSATLSIPAKISEYRYFFKATKGEVSIDQKKIGKRDNTDTGFGYLQIILKDGSLDVTSGDQPTGALEVKVDSNLINKTIAALDDSVNLDEYSNE